MFEPNGIVARSADVQASIRCRPVGGGGATAKIRGGDMGIIEEYGALRMVPSGCESPSSTLGDRPRAHACELSLTRARSSWYWTRVEARTTACSLPDNAVVTTGASK